MDKDLSGMSAPTTISKARFMPLTFRPLEPSLT